MIFNDVKEVEQIMLEAKKLTKDGLVADYIPALKKANSDSLGIAIMETDDHYIAAGNHHDMFTLQSISKVLTLALALMDHGEEEVFNKVGMEPTGDPFNSMIKLETHSPSKPLNPMINAGALAVTSMIKGKTNEEKLRRVLGFIHDMTGNNSITYNEEVATSEFETAHLNRALCYFMKQHGVIEDEVEDLLDLYTKQCAIEVNCHDLAKIGYVIANNGLKIGSNERMIPTHITQILTTFMVTCGMYNESGAFAIRVGVPAKSGVSGGILVSVPQKYGIGVYGPALDEKGNSIAGIKLMELLSKQYSLSIF